MRPLTDEELTLVFEKLKKYIGSNIKHLIEESDSDGPRVFRMIKKKVYLLTESMVKMCSAIAKEHILHAGVCLGQFSKTGKFRLGITALGVIAKYSSTKVWLKTSGEQNFLYGNHVLKAHIARVSENALKYTGVVVMTLSNVPLGFGVMAKSSQEFKEADPSAIYVFNQADVGEYLRIESDRHTKLKDDEEDDEIEKVALN